VSELTAKRQVMHPDVDTEKGWRLWGRRGTAGASIPAALTLEGVSHAYGDEQVLTDISLTVAAGEVICLLGQSGCGKSTLLRIVAGIERPQSGRLLLDAREVEGPRHYVPPEKRGVGLMFQDYALFPHLDVIANVAYGVRGLPPTDTNASAMRALDRVGLAHLAKSYPHTLSGGEQQRVALARAVAPRPGVLLMDEPFSNLDRRLKDAVREETIAVIRETRATSIIVTHDPEDAMLIADRIVLMRKGRIAQIGPPDDMYLRPSDLFSARFFSDFNEFDTVVRNGVVATPFGPIAAALPDGARAVVCIRPRGVLLRAAGFCLPGRIVSRRFAGEVDILQVAVQGFERPLTVRAPEHKPLSRGDEVGVDFDRSEILVFPAAEP
jgi:iron(III) transport system ATP-binding protein